MVTCKWLQNQVSCLLNHNMDYCCVKKYGSVQYHHSGDLSSQNHPSDCRDEVAVVENVDFHKKILECCLVLNYKIHSFCIDKMMEQDMYQPHSIENLTLISLLVILTQIFGSCVEWGSTNTGWHINIHHMKNLCTHEV